MNNPEIILPTDEDKEVYEESRVTGRYDSPLAVAMERIWLDGDTGEQQYGDTSIGSLAIRYGRQVFVTDSQGFVSGYTFDSDAEAHQYAKQFEPIVPKEYEEVE